MGNFGNTRTKYGLLVCCISILFFHPSCTHEPVNLDQADTVCFDNQILPLLQNSCGTPGCHDATSEEVDFVANSYETILPIVKPGDPKGSTLYNVITDIWGEHFMPPGHPLSLANRNLIQVWIAQGALNTKCITDTNNGNPNPDTVCFVQDILPVFQSSCALTGCHDAISHSEGYNLSTYISIMSNEEGIIPYNPGASKIYEVITSNESDDRMPPPPKAALTSAQITNIRDWILDGALNSDCPQNDCDTLSPISFSSQVFPILQNNCTSCHSSSPANGGVLLNNYQNVRDAALTQRNGTSLIAGAIRNLNGFSQMPPGSPMSTCSIRIIELWIEQGTQNN
jgi:hypothetical protein